MKSYIVVLFLFISSSVFAQSEFEKSVSKFSDSETKNKLETFKSEGIELAFDTKNITPDELINAAQKYLNFPHCMGGDGSKKKCMDCSGLLLASFRDVGINLNFHGSQEMARYGIIISDKTRLQKGDLVFFVNSYKSKNRKIVITHSGFMISDKKMIHTSSMKGVQIIDLDDPYYWNDKFLYGTRIFDINQELENEESDSIPVKEKENTKEDLK
ncbi:MAG: NlpC/P60 family protein [Bacteroidota bacterium]